MNYQLPDLAGGSSRLERFIFPCAASRIGPTNGDTVPQAQVEPGYPEPGADNTSPAGVSLGITGRLRQDSATNPTVVVQVQDLQSVAGPVTLADVEAGRADVSELLASVGTVGRLSVPRFSIQRTNYVDGDDVAQVGVDTSWALLQEINANPPDAGVGVSAECQKGSAKFAKDAHGNLLLAIPALDGSPAANLVAIWRLKPSESATFTHELTIDLDADAGGNANAYAGDVAWVNRSDDVYLLCASRAPTTNAATFETFLLRGTNGDSLSATYVGRGFSGDVSAPTEIAATDTDAGVIVALKDGVATQRMGRSVDLRTWDADGEDAGLVQFSEFSQRRDQITGTVNDVYAPSTTAAWAVTSAGEILRSLDAGMTWREINSPCDADVNLAGSSVSLNSISAFGSVLLAVGSFGTIMKGTISGDTVTFEVTRFGAGRPELQFTDPQFDATECAKTDIPGDVALYKVRMISATRAWACGSKGAIYYTANAGSTWIEVAPPNKRREFTDFVVDDSASGNVLLAVGRTGVNDAGAADATDGDKCVILFTDAETAGAPFTCIAADPDGVGFKSVTIERNDDDPTPTDAAAIGYALTYTGRVYRWDGDGSTVAVTEIAQLPRDYAYAAIHAPDQLTGGASGDVVVAAADRNSGIVYQATGANTGAGVAFTGQAIREKGRALWMYDVDVGIIGTQRALWRAMATATSRTKFCMLTLADGSVLLACRNVGKDWTEIYRADRPSAATRPRFDLQAVIPGELNRAPSLAVNVDGSIIMALGMIHYASQDGGRSWMPSSDGRLPLPLADHTVTVDYVETGGNLDARRSIIEFGGGVLYSATPSADFTKIGIYRAWHWTAGSPYYRPILQGVPLSLGVDGVRGVFQGAPAPRDTWTIRPRYGYRVSHLATDSPSAETWRSTTDDDQVTMEWDAEDAAVADALQFARNLWPCTFFGLFGTDFRAATFRISDSGNAASFTSKAVSVALDTGTAAAPNVASPPAESSILYVSGKTWTPNVWAPGPRTFYVAFTAQDVAYRILANGADWLEIEGVADLSGSAGDRAITIYGDRICWRGDSGTGVGSAGLLGTAYGFGRLLQVIIGAQATPGGYFSAGRAFFGVEVAADSEARSFLYGLAFRPVVSTEQDVSRGGIKSVRHYGRTGRVWEAVYPQFSVDAMGRKLNALMAQMREPFVIMWNGDDANSSTLVRLVDAPEISNTMGNRFDLRMIFEEVV